MYKNKIVALHNYIQSYLKYVFETFCRGNLQRQKTPIDIANHLWITKAWENKQNKFDSTYSISTKSHPDRCQTLLGEVLRQHIFILLYLWHCCHGYISFIPLPYQWLPWLLHISWSCGFRSSFVQGYAFIIKFWHFFAIFIVRFICNLSAGISGLGFWNYFRVLGWLRIQQFLLCVGVIIFITPIIIVISATVYKFLMNFR